MSPARKSNTEQLSDSEDWTKLTDISQRRRVQNRIAQRNRRKKLKSLGGQERQLHVSSPSPSKSLESTPEPNGSNDWPMSFQDTKDLLSQIDQTRNRLHDYLSGISNTNQAQTPSQSYWDPSAFPAFDVQELTALSHDLDQLDSLSSLVSTNTAFDNSCFDFTVAEESMTIAQAFMGGPEMTPPSSNTPRSSNSNLAESTSRPFKTYSLSPQEKHSTNNAEHHGNTPLHIAVQNGHHSIIRLLIETGANINAPNSSNLSPLQTCILASRPSTAHFLLDLGADPTCLTTKGETVLHLAVRTGDVSLVQLLLQYPVDVNARDDGGETALHAAVAAGHEDVVRAMLDKGVNSQARVGVVTPVDASFDWSMISDL